MTILAVACARVKEMGNTEKPQIGQELTLTASVPEIELLSKTTRDAEGKVFWSAAEEISLFYGSGENGGSKFTSTNNAAAKTAQFSGVINVITGVVEDTDDISFWGIYPYNSENSCDGSSATMVIPNIQTSKEGSFSDGVFPSIGRSLGLVMGFYNVCGGFKFQLSQENITSITFRGNNNEVIAGKVKVAFGQDGKPAVTDIVSGEQEIVVTPAGGGAFQTGVDYFIVIRPVTFSQGVTFEFQKADGSRGTRMVNASFPINRSQFQHSASAIDSGVTFPVPNAVDLGLSVRWMACNLGASSPEEYGDYYAWGEIEPYYSSHDPLTWKTGKTAGYTWASYKWCNGSSSSLTKYNIRETRGTVDGKNILSEDDDAAHIILGGEWRLPTDTEWQELIDNCTWTWTTANGINGFLVTSNRPGYTDNSIFIPAAGVHSGAMNLFSAGTYGYYWSSTIDPSSSQAEPWRVMFHSSSITKDSSEIRTKGFSIRPVYGKFIHVSGVTLDKSSVIIATGGTEYQLNASVSPSNASESDLVWTSSDESVAIVWSGGIVVGLNEGEATITATSVDGGFTASCRIRVVVPGPQPIDLGVSVKWASCNLGAIVPEEYGDYYAWGETEPLYEEGHSQDDICDPGNWKDYTRMGYNWSSYKWSTSSDPYDSYSIIKYNTDSSYGSVDNKTVLDPEDDAARVILGRGWRMPTGEELSELQSLSWVWTTLNGVSGYSVTGNNGNSIFIPAAGLWDGYGVYPDAYPRGYYWLSDLNFDWPDVARALFFDSSSIDYTTGYTRSSGLPIRPVYID